MKTKSQTDSSQSASRMRPLFAAIGGLCVASFAATVVTAGPAEANPTLEDPEIIWAIEVIHGEDFDGDGWVGPPEEKVRPGGGTGGMEL